MSSTNKTPTIELSQYVGTDKPTYLVDYNTDMLHIDNAIATDRVSIAAAQNTADTAETKADTNATNIESIQEELNDSGTGLSPRMTSAENAINNISSLIGNGTPTTTDKTIIGAINELHGDMGTYQIDSLLKLEITADGVKTWSQLIDDMYAALLNALNARPTNGKYHILKKLRLADTADVYCDDDELKNTVSEEFTRTRAMESGGIYGIVVSMRSNGSKFFRSDMASATPTTRAYENEIPESGKVLELWGEWYTKIK